MTWSDYIDLFTDAKVILEKGGFWALLAIIFLENGVIIGVVLPGDYLLFTAGMFALDLGVNIYVMTLSAFICAILGTFLGYQTGYYTGKKFLQKDTWLIKKKHIVLTRAYFIRYGGKTIMYGKFLPYVRTLSPMLAGVVEMPIKKMMRFNILGSGLWTGSLILGGYFLGTTFPILKDNIHYFIFAFIGITTSIVVISYLRTSKK